MSKFMYSGGILCKGFWEKQLSEQFSGCLSDRRVKKCVECVFFGLSDNGVIYGGTATNSKPRSQ